MKLSAVLFGDLGADPGHLLTERLTEIRSAQCHDHLVLEIIH